MHEKVYKQKKLNKTTTTNIDVSFKPQIRMINKQLIILLKRAGAFFNKILTAKLRVKIFAN